MTMNTPEEIVTGIVESVRRSNHYPDIQVAYVLVDGETEDDNRAYGVPVDHDFLEPGQEVQLRIDGTRATLAT